LNMPLMRGYSASRADLFAGLDRPNPQPLPAQPYVFARWKSALVALDYHVEVDSSWYSVPFALIKQEVDVRVAAQTFEIFHRGQLVASHVRTPERRSHVTVADHMLSAHRCFVEWTPARLLAQATKTGPAVAFCEMVMADRPHPEHGFRTCLGVLSLIKTYGPTRVDAACQPGVTLRARPCFRYRIRPSVRSSRPGSTAPSWKATKRPPPSNTPTFVAAAIITEKGPIFWPTPPTTDCWLLA